MAYRSLIVLVLAVLAFAVTPSHAGYAQLKVPQGFTQTASGPAFKPTVPKSAPAANGTMKASNDAVFVPGGAKGTTTVNVPQPVPVPWSAKWAESAPAKVLDILARNPAAALGVAAIPLVLDWLNQKLDPDNEFWTANSQGYSHHKKAADGSGNCATGPWTVSTSTNSPPSYGSGWCLLNTQVSGPYSDGSYSYAYFWGKLEPGSDPLWDVTPVTPQEMPQYIPQPPEITPELPFALPEPLPMELPIINPSTAPVPQPQPLKVPLSDPVPLPNTNPQEYSQPWVVVTPSPTPAAPWRVDVKPETSTTTDPTPQPGPVTVPAPLPDGSGGDPAPSTPSENADFCALHPTAIACLEKGDPGTLDPVPFPNKDVDNSAINPDSRFAPGSGACPAPKSITVSGRTVEIGLDKICEFADMIKPLVLAFAWLSAAFTFFGFSRKD